MYNSWVIKLVTAQLGAGRPVGEIKVPTGDPDCKTNLFRWLSLAVDELNKDPAGIVRPLLEGDRALARVGGGARYRPRRPAKSTSSSLT